MTSLRHMFHRFIGPGYLVAVGYMDPGNWATDLAAGSKFGYSLLFVVLLSNFMAIFLQYLCIKLGIASKKDLSENCRIHCHPYLNLFLYVLCEIAIIATDLAELIGSAIAMNLLFGIPLYLGILITALDVLLILVAWNKKWAFYSWYFWWRFAFLF
jgi:manganese transport protein